MTSQPHRAFTTSNTAYRRVGDNVMIPMLGNKPSLLSMSTTCEKVHLAAGSWLEYMMGEDSLLRGIVWDSMEYMNPTEQRHAHYIPSSV